MLWRRSQVRKNAFDRAKHVIAHEFRLTLDEPLGSLGFDLNSVSQDPECTRVTLIYEISGADFKVRNPDSSLISLDNDSIRRVALALYIELDLADGSIRLILEYAQDLLRWLLAVEEHELHSQIVGWEANIRQAGRAIAAGLELQFAAHGHSAS